MRGFAATLVVAMFIAPVSLVAQDGAPPPAAPAQLEIQANLAFSRGEYATALPIYRKLADGYQNDAGRLGPIKEKMRVCETAVATSKANPATQPALFSSLSAGRHPHPTPKPGELMEMSIKELGNFDYDPEHGSALPPDITRLNGVKIRLSGFMIPMDQAENITEFALVPTIGICCIGAPPQIQHTIVVHCPKGKAVGYCPDAIVIEGQLTVDEKKDQGYPVSIFEVEVSSVKPAPK